MTAAEEIQHFLALDRTDYEAGWRDAYQIGFDAGVDVGYGQRVEEDEERWRAFAVQYQRIIGQLPQDELERRRREPSGDLYHDALKRRGGHEYQGGAVDWNTGLPIIARGAA